MSDYSYYGPYIPTTWVCALLLVLFLVTGIGHLVQAVYYKMYWLIPTMCACALFEIIGWSGRLWSSQRPSAWDAYILQFVTTYFAPVFMTAAIFIILGLIITEVGIEFSRLKPRTHYITVITAHLLALIIQLVGSGMVASASGEIRSMAERGAKIMVGGVVIQMAFVTIYVFLALEYFIRVYKNKPLRPRTPPAEGTSNTLLEKESFVTYVSPKIRLLIIGLAVSTLFVYVRSIYRTIASLNGWDESTITNQPLFILLDGVPIVLAMMSLNVFHPGYLLHPRHPRSSDETAVSRESISA